MEETRMTKPAAAPMNANSLIEEQLDTHLGKIETEASSDALAFNGQIVNGIEDFIRDAVERRKADSQREKLSVLLETPGGYIDIAQRIADTFRHHYKVVDFIIPNYAMSAGTVLVMSGDAIWMDYYSVLGPIDPQVSNREGRWVPALGYLHKFNELIKKSKSKAGLSDAEIAYLLSKFDPGEMYSFQQAKDLSTKLLKEWLVKYKFKNWTQTETKKKKVTPKMRTDRALKIANLLNNTDHWSSHSRPISMEVLRRELELKIEDFGTPQWANLSLAVKCYHQLLRDYMIKTGKIWAVHVV